jgi:hypothetical protein
VGYTSLNPTYGAYRKRVNMTKIIRSPKHFKKGWTYGWGGQRIWGPNGEVIKYVNIGNMRAIETDTEILMSIPPSKQGRTKSIKGCRWDTKHKCWAFPKTKSAIAALKAEFKDDLTIDPITKTKASVSIASSANIVQRGNDKLKTEIRELQERIESLEEELKKAKRDLASAQGKIVSNRCGACGNGIPRWAHGVCQVCAMKERDHKRYARKR